MKSIIINGAEVLVSPKTYKRIERIAAEKKVSLAEAVSFLLNEVK